MPTYIYRDGEHQWEIIKSVSQIDAPEACPTCGKDGARAIVAPAINRTAAGDWNNQTWHPALGCYTASNRHARQIAKRRGLEEVGTESPDRLHDHFEKQREETRSARWAEADKGQDVAETLTIRETGNG